MNSQSTILIVDDTQTNIDILVELLDGYDLIVATNGQLALDMLEDEKVDLILLDIMMPIMDGFETCEKIKTNNSLKDIPIIFLTAKTDDESIQKGFELGGVDYISKPFRPFELIARVKTHLNFKKQEKKIIEQNKYLALTELVNNIAHQWRQPLSVISTISSGMQIQHELQMIDESETIKQLSIITENAQYLSSTLDNFKDFTDSNITKTTFNMKRLIQKNYDFIFGNVLKNEIELELDIKDEININGVENQFIEVILHIIKNSVDAITQDTNTSGRLKIDTDVMSNIATISIIDNGGGIDESIIDKIFEPYYTTKHQSIGTGLGLYMVNKIITETFSGDLEILNVKNGVCFNIKIPIYKNEKT
ncbi:MAG: hybrid sensor histidine kinase/response regulator [Campylobacterota bacterium]|nr:hybrid sensor histidine kinase/response regulator [Campylobacterota bacterium]